MSRRVILLFFLIFPVFSFFLSLCIGAYHIPLSAIIKMITAKTLEAITFGRFSLELNYPSTYETILFQIRLPRVITAMLVGSALAVSGAVLQATFRNPLVDSYIIGISAGAAFGAALAFGFLPASIEVSAFVFSMVAMFLTYTLAKIRGRVTVISLILAGIIMNAFFSALTSMLKFLMEHEKLAGVVYWLMGSFASADWSVVSRITIPITAGCIAICLMRWHLNVLSMGEEAQILGIDVGKMRFIYVSIVSFMTAIAVAHCGIIGWVGLIMPHIVRMAFGPDHKTLIPLSIAIGAGFMVLADDVARALTTFEIPIGIVTTILGIPFFVYLLRKTGGGEWYA
ncbi:FecCD family ABC transporter permease [Archaeoglobus veneficus]|uniref:ABC-type transporter, integral membrane subunit n=1 Tax=Archaeoglobus veneficus (strain DSM 11195 / SNP6) TaxID=693661 RepID=F2KPN2_ARCVS|nr:iron ABC transporter permease [Archaeoglobus veneficus]AEA47560.1 ABC-type transporter, integral membrane subunit [Archaeoglobus veneficus SNP6]